MANKTSKIKRQTTSKPKKKCPICGEEKSPTAGFFISTSPLYQIDGRVPICKNCIKDYIVNDDGTINKTNMKTMMQRIDKPLFWDSLESAYVQYRREHSYVTDEEVSKHGREIISLYFKNIMLRQDKDKSFVDSEKEGFVHNNSNASRNEQRRIIQKYTDTSIEGVSQRAKKKKSDEEVITLGEDVFEVTPEMVNLFGEGYTRIEYKNMYRKYNAIKMNYSIQTNLHQEALVTYVRFKVKEELATAKGDVAEAQKWYNAAQDAADNAKLTPKQLTQADLQGGINSFSEIFKAVEQAVDVIPILPRFKFRPNDALDFNIWCYINYARELQGLPQCTYKEVYEFYDKKKQEYLDQYGDPYGIFEDEPTEQNRPSVEKFITLPKDYESGDA